MFQFISSVNYQYPSVRFSSNISSKQAVEQQWEVTYWKRMDLQQEIKIIYIWRHAVGMPYYQNAKYEVNPALQASQIL
jgi:hypothetical protein